MASQKKLHEGWKLVRLEEVAEVVMGQSPPGELVIDWDGSDGRAEGLPFLQGNAEFSVKFPKPLKWCTQPFRVSNPGDILISVRAPVGETNQADRKLSIGRGLAAVRFNKPGQAFGWHVLNHAKKELDRLTQGSTFPAISSGELRNLSILLPPTPEQRSIAAVLDSIDEAIENTEGVIITTEQLRDSLLHQLLTHGVPGWHTEWKEVPGLGMTPGDWDVVRLGEVTEINRLNWDPSEGSPILYLDLTAVTSPGSLAPPKELTAAHAPSRARRRVQSGDILVSTVRPNLRGFARVCEAQENLVASTGFAVVSPKPVVEGSFVYHHVMTTRFAMYLEGAATGQAYPAVRPGDVADFRLPVPSLPEQQVIVWLLDSVDASIDEARKERESLQSLKDSTADALLTGRKRIHA